MKVCPNREEACSIYNITIPDIDATNGRILQRPNLFYYHWQKPSSAVEFNTTCADLEVYTVMKSATQADLILSFTPSVMVGFVFCSYCSSGSGDT